MTADNFLLSDTHHDEEYRLSGQIHTSTDYVVNDATLASMREHALAGPVISQLAAAPQTRCADRSAWLAHLDQRGVNPLQVTPDPVGIATQGALWGR